MVQNTVEALSFAIRDSAVNNFGPNFGAHNAMPALNTLTNSALNTPFLAITNNSPILTTLSDITINSAESAAVGIVQAAEQGLNVVFDNLIDGAGSYLTHTMPVSLETSYIITNQEYYPLIDSFE